MWTGLKRHYFTFSAMNLGLQDIPDMDAGNIIREDKSERNKENASKT